MSRLQRNSVGAARHDIRVGRDAFQLTEAAACRQHHSNVTIRWSWIFGEALLLLSSRAMQASDSNNALKVTVSLVSTWTGSETRTWPVIFFIHFQFPGPRVKFFSITSCLYHFPCGMGRQIFNRTFFPWQSGMTHSEEPWIVQRRHPTHSCTQKVLYGSSCLSHTHDWQESLRSLQSCSGPYGSSDDTLEGNCNCRVTVCSVFPNEDSLNLIWLKQTLKTELAVLFESIIIIYYMSLFCSAPVCFPLFG